MSVFLCNFQFGIDIKMETFPPLKFFPDFFKMLKGKKLTFFSLCRNVCGKKSVCRMFERRKKSLREKFLFHMPHLKGCHTLLSQYVKRSLKTLSSLIETQLATLRRNRKIELFQPFCDTQNPVCMESAGAISEKEEGHFRKMRTLFSYPHKNIPLHFFEKR